MDISQNLWRALLTYYPENTSLLVQITLKVTENGRKFAISE